MLDFSKITFNKSVDVDGIPGCSVKKDTVNSYLICSTKGTFHTRIAVYSLMFTYEITNITTAEVDSHQQAGINTLCKSLATAGYTKEEIFSIVDLINLAIHYQQEHSMDYIYAKNDD